jgi:hypothetical protein
MQFGARRLMAVAIVLGASLLGSPEPTFAGPTLYTGTIQLQLSSWSGCFFGQYCYNDFGAGYSFPFGTSISYPSLNNLPSGNTASVSGSAPAAVAIGSNEIALQTSLYDTSLPTSWISVSFASTHFTGGHAAGSFYGGGAPGSTSTYSLTPVPFSRLGVTFSGTPTEFGGTLHLLGTWKTRYYTFQSPPGDEFPLSPIGGSFAGTAKAQVTHSPRGTVVKRTIWGFPWTTGRVRALAPEPSGFGDYSGAFTYRSATGSDQRTPQGAGNIQLVTPFVVRTHMSRDDRQSLSHQAGVAILSLHFVPEPSRGLQLLAGLSALAVLSGLNRRRE